MDLLVKLAEFNEIESKRLILRPLKMSDAEDMFAYASKKENLKYIFPAHTDLETTKISIANLFMKEPLGKWAIVEKSTDKMIGTIDFVKVNPFDSHAELGYVLNKDYWGQGYMTEVVKTVTDFSFQEFGLKTLDIVVDKRNIASSRVAEKCNYKKFDEYKSANKYTKEIVNFIKYRLNRTDYWRIK
jgi:Acetyltransferases, including N-acetylases of ribosomal proteins